MKKLALVLAVLCMTAMVFAAGAKEKADDGKMDVVATSTMIHDLVKVIGGDRINTVGLVGVGVDPHLYQATAGDVTKMNDADVVVYNGLHFEGRMGEIFASLTEQGKNIICIEDSIPVELIQKDPEGAPDPHIWWNMTIWTGATKHIAAELAKFDPANADYYLANADAYLVELELLDAYIINRVAEIPETQRILITAHDAFEYFASSYGFTVKGVQGISTETEAATSDVRELANFIVENNIKAMFVETSVSSKTIEAVQSAVKAQGSEVVIGGTLYSDSLGDESTNTETFIKTYKSNVDTIANALK